MASFFRRLRTIPSSSAYRTFSSSSSSSISSSSSKNVLRNTTASTLTVTGVAGYLWYTNELTSNSHLVYAEKSSIKPIHCEDGTTVLPWSAPSRATTLSRLQNEEFDLVIIGGGCVGAGCAWEASTRGLKVALVERDDFAAGTSGRSTKLIHGGIRYLEAAFKNFDKEMYHLVHEALMERYHLLHAAPYMAHPLPTLIPIYSLWEIPYMWIGVKLYDYIAGTRRAVPASYYISRDEALYQFPMLNPEGLEGGIVYYDGQHNDTRMNLMIALTAAQQGAAVANYINVESILKDNQNRAAGVQVKDLETGKVWNIRAKGVINATGCFGDAVRKMDDPKCQDLILGAAGVHIILPDHYSPDNMGLIVPKTSDGRVLFFLPWEGSTICGTTDAPSDITMTPRPTEDDVNFIIEESNRFLTRKIAREDVKAAWSGIRPLIKDPKKLSEPGAKSSQLSRSHVVEVSPSGMVSILGGKWTTYRLMAEEAINAFAQGPAKSHSGLSSQITPSKTLHMQLLGADRAGIVINKKYDRIPITLREVYGLEKDIAKHLSMNYGTRALQVAEIMKEKPALKHRLVPTYPFLAAEVIFAAEQEYAFTAIDVLARRTRLAFLNRDAAKQALPEVIELLGSVHHWNRARKDKELKDSIQFLDTMR